MNQSKTKTIMVVDDDPFVLDVVEGHIEQLGHTLLTASSGEEALKMAEDHDRNVDLLLTDVVMPNMNGLELAEAMVASIPSIKVIFMSGCVQPSIGPLNTPSFENGFVRKPFSAKTLVTHIKKALTEID